MNEFIKDIKDILKEYKLYLEIRIEPPKIRFALYRHQYNVFDEYVNTVLIEEWNNDIEKFKIETVYDKIGKYINAYDIMQKNKE